LDIVSFSRGGVGEKLLLPVKSGGGGGGGDYFAPLNWV